MELRGWHRTGHSVQETLSSLAPPRECLYDVVQLIFLISVEEIPTKEHQMQRFAGNPLKNVLFAISVSTITCAQPANPSSHTNRYETADIGVNFLGALNGSLTTGNPAQPIPTNTVGGMIEFRFLIHSLVGFEGSYSYRQPNQAALVCPFLPAGSPPEPCPQVSAPPSSTLVQQITGDWIFSKQTPRFTYFALAGLGGIFTSALTGGNGTTDNLAYEYGGGVDWKLKPRLGVRLQYRGDINKVPDISSLSAINAVPYTSGNGWMHTAEPMIGVYYRWF